MRCAPSENFVHIEPDDGEFFRRTEAENAALRRAWKVAGPLDWGGWLLRQSTPVLSRQQVNEAPNESGIYALWTKAGELIYIGKSVALSQRLTTHWRNSRLMRLGWWESFSYVRVPEYALGSVERAHIYAIEPDWNDLYEPAVWPGHAAMVAALHAEWP